MQNQKRRKTVVIILTVLTVITAISAIYLGYRITQDDQLTPEDIAAAPGSCCNNDPDSSACVPAGATDVGCINVDDCGEAGPWVNQGGPDQTRDSWCGYNTGAAGGTNGVCEPTGGDCSFDCNEENPTGAIVECNSDCAGQVSTRTTDICRGKANGANCQMCEGVVNRNASVTDGQGRNACHPPSGSNCDIPCGCFDPGTPGWNTCYERGPGYNPDPPYFGGDYECRNTQTDVIWSHDGTQEGIWNCRWEDGQSFDACVATSCNVDIQAICTGAVLANNQTSADVSWDISQEGITEARAVLRVDNLNDGWFTQGSDQWTQVVTYPGQNLNGGRNITINRNVNYDVSVSFDERNPSVPLGQPGDYTEICRQVTQVNCSVQASVTPSPTPPTTTITTSLTATPTQVITTPNEEPSSTPSPTPGPDDIVVDKSSIETCSADATSSDVVYTIVITNPSDTDRTVRVVDTYSQEIADFIDLDSISPASGEFVNGVITWEDLVLPANGSLTLSYSVSIPDENFGEYTNTVVVEEDDDDDGNYEEVASDVETIVVDCLPPTALISDEVDRILLGVVLIGLGYLVYHSGLHSKFGEFIWQNGVSSFLSKFKVRTIADYESEVGEEIQKKIED